MKAGRRGWCLLPLLSSGLYLAYNTPGPRMLPLSLGVLKIAWRHLFSALGTHFKVLEYTAAVYW
jgi:hypothetical protein